MCLLSLGLVVPFSAKAGTVVKLNPHPAAGSRAPVTHMAASTPPATDSIPRSWYATHAENIRHLNFVTFKTLHEEVNPILREDWEAQTTISQSSDPDLTTKGGGRTMAGAFLDSARAHFIAGKNGLVRSLARLTAYWPGEAGDPYTIHHESSTGIHLHVGHCAVDPSIIPYGSVVEIPGVGEFLAVDTGSAVVARTAALRAGINTAERGALVIDLFFEHACDGEKFAAESPKFVDIKWWTPSTASDAKVARGLFADGM
jgi:3D (Asp-Asp-Asp) domain-containing protein